MRERERDRERERINSKIKNVQTFVFYAKFHWVMHFFAIFFKNERQGHTCGLRVANESFNGMIWNRIPKANHVALNTLSLGVYDAIAHFNMGSKASLDILEDLNYMLLYVIFIYISELC